MAMKRNSILCVLALTAGLAVGAPTKAAALTDCEMRFTLSGWSLGYKTASGKGTITCNNGQTAQVNLDAKGGGLTAGKTKIREGYGKFSEVGDISELFGSYIQAAADAGAGKSSTATAMTKGEVSLALAGHGTGINLGISFGKFTISKR
jgi:hypothetical protein